MRQQKNKNYQEIYASMAHISNHDEGTSRNFGDNSQLTNQIFDYGATCHMTPKVSDFIPGLLDDTDKHIEVADGYHVMAKQKGQVRIKMCDDNGDTFIATFYNVILAPDLCDRLFSIIMLINLRHTCLFQKGFCTVYLGAKERNSITLPHILQRKYAFWGEIKEMSKTNKLPSRKKNALELLYHRLGHRSTRSLLDGDNANVLEDIELRKYIDPFFTHARFLP